MLQVVPCIHAAKHLTARALAALHHQVVVQAALSAEATGDVLVAQALVSLPGCRWRAPWAGAQTPEHPLSVPQDNDSVGPRPVGLGGILQDEGVCSPQVGAGYRQPLVARENGCSYPLCYYSFVCSICFHVPEEGPISPEGDSACLIGQGKARCI